MSDYVPVLWITPRTLEILNDGFPVGQRLEVSPQQSKKYSVKLYANDADLIALEKGII